MRLCKLLSIVLAIDTLIGMNPSYAEELKKANQISCENPDSSKKSKKMICGSTAGIAAILALVPLSFLKWRKHKDEPAQNEIKKEDKGAATVSKVSVDHTENQENWIKILSGDKILQGCFRYKSGTEFRQDTDENLEINHDFIQVFFPTYERSEFANQDLNIKSCRELWEKIANEKSQATITRIKSEMRLNFIRMLLFWGFTVTLCITDRDDKPTYIYGPSDSKELFSNDGENCLEGRDFRLQKIDLGSERKPWMSEINDHNRLRITLVLMSLKIFGLGWEFKLFRSCLSSQLRCKKIADNRSDLNGRCIGATGKCWNDTDRTKTLLELIKTQQLTKAR